MKNTSPPGQLRMQQTTTQEMLKKYHPFAQCFANNLVQFWPLKILVEHCRRGKGQEHEKTMKKVYIFFTFFKISFNNILSLTFY